MLEKQLKNLEMENDMLDERNRSLQARMDVLQGLLDEENSMWKSKDGMRRHNSGMSRLTLHAKENIHEILTTTERLQGISSCDPDMFAWLHREFVKATPKTDDAPLFTEDQKEDAGNHCLMDKKEALLLALFRKRGNMIPDCLAIMFGTYSYAVSQYLVFVDRILDDILPTAKNLEARIKETKTVREFEKLVPRST